jgi:predicted dehydrogenase
VISAEVEGSLDYHPSFPPHYRPGLGLVGCGDIARSWHLPTYAEYGVRVVGVYDPVPAATAGIRGRFPFVERVFAGLDELLGDEEIEIVDVATRPDVRPEVIRRALGAGKHVLAQKPLALDLPAARELADDAEQRGLRLAVNQNGRWSPPWRIATLLIDAGAVGDVLAVTHLHDRPLPPLVGTHFDELEHFVIYDYFVHWIDICRCWLDGKSVQSVRALDYRTPDQPAAARSPWAAWVEIHYTDGASAMIRNVGEARTEHPSTPFWVHGTEGTIRGSVLLGSDYVELERNGVTSRYALDGAWYPDGFAGAIGELVTSIAEDREPFNSARHNLLSLQMTLAACRSAEEGGRAVTLNEISA